MKHATSYSMCSPPDDPEIPEGVIDVMANTIINRLSRARLLHDLVEEYPAASTTALTDTVLDPMNTIAALETAARKLRAEMQSAGGG